MKKDTLSNWLKKIIAYIVLSVAVLLPYRLRIAYSDRLGRMINSFYAQYLRLLTWFFRKLET